MIIIIIWWGIIITMEVFFCLAASAVFGLPPGLQGFLALRLWCSWVCQENHCSAEITVAQREIPEAI